MKYSIDTSAILEGWVRYYPPDVFRSVWAKLDDLVAKGDLRATEEVFVELSKREGDAVYKWAKAHRVMFVPIDEEIQLVSSDILAKFPKLMGEGGNRHAADPWVIALARINGAAVVTGEQPGSPSKPRIPDVCQALGIKCISLVDLFREESWVL